MSGKEHHYAVKVIWTGNLGTGTSGYRDYSRDHMISVEGKPDIAGSSDRAFRGNPDRWNPEDMLLASISACHKLWYLHFCAVSGIVVTDYADNAEATMVMDEDGGGQFTSAVLRPHITIEKGDPLLAIELHTDAHEKCFIARSLNFPVTCEPVIVGPATRAEA